MKKKELSVFQQDLERASRIHFDCRVARSELLGTVHRARCRGVAWQEICFAILRATGRNPVEAATLKRRLAKGLHDHRKKHGLKPCPPRLGRRRPAQAR